VSRARIRILLAAALVLINLLVLAGPIKASDNLVTGTLIFNEDVLLAPDAIAVVTLTDRSKDATAGTIIGQQRIDGGVGPETPFAVPFDPAAINQKHAYSIYASLISGPNQYQSAAPVPVITGGPTDGLQVEVVAPAYQTPASITGTIALPADTELSEAAVAYAAILNTTTGRLVARQVIASPTVFPIPFEVAFDAALLNPENSYVAAAGVIDGTTLYQTAQPVPLAPGANLALEIVKTATTIPGPSASGPPLPSASTEPGESPAATETASTEPSLTPTRPPRATETPAATPAPTPTPTEAPTATPAPTAPPSPTAAPTESAAASETPLPSASTSASASAEPSPLTVTGQVSYEEPYQLTPAAVLQVTVIQVDPNGPTVVAVGEQQIKNPGQVPIAFSVPLDPTLLNPENDAFLFATLTDGTNAWTTAGQIPVATNGAPTTDLDVPLTFRPDLIEGQVTGAITGLPSDISLDAWAMAFVLDQSDGAVIGLQSGPINGSTLVPFNVPFLVADIDPAKAYVAGATVFDDTRTWRSAEGVPVITNGAPFTNVVLTVDTVGPSPTPTTEATAPPASAAAATGTAPAATPRATATPTAPSSSTGAGIDPIVLLGILAVVIIGGGAILLFMRR
jgi:uncharacterized lipoprotein YbaY